MSIVYAAAWAYNLPSERTGTPLQDGLAAVRQQSGHGTLNAEAAHRGGMPNMEGRVVLHSDLNNCYASIECMLHPELRGKYIAVCGSTCLLYTSRCV